jgi:hypothetical protein
MYTNVWFLQGKILKLTKESSYVSLQALFILIRAVGEEIENKE